MSDKPVAREIVQDIFVTPACGREPVLQNRKEYVRVGHCAAHRKDSKQFTGVSTAGWMFKCAGTRKRDENDAGEAHYFVNTPPNQAAQRRGR